MKKYKPVEFEKSWRDYWEEQQLYNVDNKLHAGKPKYYCLDMFPYPSGTGLHVGHWRGYVLSDVWSRYKMLQGYNVLHPMGWDNFGLPAENDAIKKGIHPKISTKNNINNIRRQLKEIGCVYDWSREITTSSPDYYKWTQWIFIQLYKKGLAYQKLQPVNWCDSCKVVLANEEVDGGKCERCGNENILKINKNQWMLKITDYAERLLNDLDKLDWPSKVKEMQRNWIGRSEGAIIRFPVKTIDNINENIEVFTTRPDTIFGVTYLVLAPEHPLISKLVSPEREVEVNCYIKRAQAVSYVERMKEDRPKTGVFTGTYACNPLTNRDIPIWVADYVLMDYGTGAIMAVPAHDERDFKFAKEYGLEIIQVIDSDSVKKDNEGNLLEAYTGDGKLINSQYIDQLNIEEAKKKIINILESKGVGEPKVNYKLRDWIFARQRYWGEPIPMIHCEKCGTLPVPEEELPVLLPDIESYKPTGTAESPLASIADWVNTSCPKCGGSSKRETDTMPQWAGSSWYFLRYVSPHCDNAIVDKELMNEWLPVDMYVGGVEHAVLHLLYARFWTKFLYDIGVVSFEEPFTRLFNQGMVCRIAYKCPKENLWLSAEELKDDFGKDNVHCPNDGELLIKSMEKMSKSKSNGVSPDGLVESYGTDSVRLYELFSGDPLQDCEWKDDGIKGCYSFLTKTWSFVIEANEKCKLGQEATLQANKLLHSLIKKVTDRVEAFKFNTAISAFMEFINKARKIPEAFSKETIESYLILLSPFAPHICEELWHNCLGHKESIFLAKWPVYNSEFVKEDIVEIIVQINGKYKVKLTVAPFENQEDLVNFATNNESVRKLLEDKTIVKSIVVPNKIVNFVVKDD